MIVGWSGGEGPRYETLVCARFLVSSAVALALWPQTASGEEIDPDALASIAARGPSVFEVHRGYARFHETSHPHLLFDLEGVAGRVTMPVATGKQDATLLAYSGTFGTGAGTDEGGIRFGIDTSSVSLHAREDDDEPAWSYETSLLYVAGHLKDPEEPPSATRRVSLGLLLRYSPLVAGSGSASHFATGETVEKLAAPRGDNEAYSTVQYGAFVYGKLPIVDELALLIDRGGPRLRSFRSLPSGGPVERWGVIADWNHRERRAEAGFGLAELRLLGQQLVVSSEMTAGYEDGNLGVDHADAEASLTLFRDRDRPIDYNDNEDDFHLKLRGGGSYYSLPGLGRTPGGRFSIDAASRHFSLGFGLSRDYYKDLIRMPLVGQTLGTVRLTVAL